MSDSNRRQFLKGALATFVQVTGSVTLASAAVASEKEKHSKEGDPLAEDLQKRADQLADAVEADADANANANAAAGRQFLNLGGLGGGGWRNGGWRNGGGGWGGGGWRNGGWRNGGGGWGGGGWRNGGWRNW